MFKALLFLVLQVTQGKAERKVIIVLLRFMYLTLRICVGFELKTLSKEEKSRKVQRGRNMNSLASNSQWRAVKGEQRQEEQFTRHQLAMASPKASNSREHQRSHASNSQRRAKDEQFE